MKLKVCKYPRKGSFVALTDKRIAHTVADSVSQAVKNFQKESWDYFSKSNIDFKKLYNDESKLVLELDSETDPEYFL